jgi:hypothetical protein
MPNMYGIGQVSMYKCTGLYWQSFVNFLITIEYSLSWRAV